MKKRPEMTDVNATPGLLGVGPLPGLAAVGAFNESAIENLLDTKGIRGFHYKSAPNPDRETLEAGANPNTREANWGFRYYQVREIRAVPQQMALEHRLNVQGIWGLHTVILNLKGHYLDGDQDLVFMSPHDLIVLTETIAGVGVTTEVKQMAEFNPNGPLQLNYRIESVGYIADRVREYVEDQDFSIVDGKICWLPRGRRPAFSDGKGAILTIVYYAKPIYIIKNVPHAIRVLPSNSTGSGSQPRKATYGPQLAFAAQSWVRDDGQQLLDFNGLPTYPGYPSTKNVTGGSF